MTRDEWRVSKERYASRGIDRDAASRGAAFFSKTRRETEMGESVTPVGSGIGGNGGGKTDQPALPEDLAGLVEAGRRMSQRLDMMDCETVLQMADAIEALAAGRDVEAGAKARERRREMSGPYSACFTSKDTEPFVYGVDGPGIGFGYHAWLGHPQNTFTTFEEAEKAARMMNIAFNMGEAERSQQLMRLPKGGAQ